MVWTRHLELCTSSQNVSLVTKTKNYPKLCSGINSPMPKLEFDKVEIGRRGKEVQD